jgi:MFS family permease
MAISSPPLTTRPRSIWRNLDFVLLFSGQAVSWLGSQISYITFPLLVLALTHSPAQAGIVGGLRGVPYFLLSLPAGALADRWDRKRVMMLCDAGRALALGSIPLALAFGQLSLAQLYLVSLGEGTLFVFFNMAESSAVPHVVGREQITAALSQSTVGESVASIVGQSLSGMLWSAGRMVPFLVDAISYGASVISLTRIKTRFQDNTLMESTGLWREIWEGILWLWRQPVLRILALIIGVLQTFSAGWVLILILRAQQLGANPFAIGLIFAAGSVGSILGALIVPGFERRFRFGQVMTWGAMLWPATWLFYLFSPNLIVLALGNTIAFIIVPVYMTIQYSYRLRLIPDHLQGRVNSVFRLIAFGAQPLGLALTGLALQAWSVAWAILAFMVPQVVISIVAIGYRKLRTS